MDRLGSKVIVQGHDGDSQSCGHPTILKDVEVKILPTFTPPILGLNTRANMDYGPIWSGPPPLSVD